MEKNQSSKARFVTNTSASEWVNDTHKGQINDKPSLTQEGLSEPMSTIIDRFQRGQLILGSQTYYDSEHNENFETDPPFKESEFDLSDIDIAREAVQKHKEALDDQRKSVAKKEKEKADQKLFEEMLARKNQADNQQQQQQQQQTTQTNNNNPTSWKTNL